MDETSLMSVFRPYVSALGKILIQGVNIAIGQRIALLSHFLGRCPWLW